MFYLIFFYPLYHLIIYLVNIYIKTSNFKPNNFKLFIHSWVLSPVYSAMPCLVKTNSQIVWSIGGRRSPKENHSTNGKGTQFIVFNSHLMFYNHIQYFPECLTISPCYFNLIKHMWIVSHKYLLPCLRSYGRDGETLFIITSFRWDSYVGEN